MGSGENHCETDEADAPSRRLAAAKANVEYRVVAPAGESKQLVRDYDVREADRDQRQTGESAVLSACDWCVIPSN